MKLLFCPACHDVFKLDLQLRFCECGRCCGRYEADYQHAVVNGQGVSLAIDNRTLWQYVYFSSRNDYNSATHEEAVERFAVRCWVRAHEGQSNPHTRVDPKLAQEASK